MNRAFLTCICLFFLTYASFSQEYSYTHYDITDGLAGSVVYCITQDKDGFIWTGTETGVSRFDGTHFKTFTGADGLPDIEIIQIFGDSKGRVWMAPFRKSICYYYQGKIHNQENDSLLRKIQLRENVQNFAEDSSGNILIQENTALQLYGGDGTIHQFDSIGGLPIRNCAAISRSSTGGFLVQAGHTVFTFSAKGSSEYCPAPMLDAVSAFVALNPAGIIYRLDLRHAVIRSFITGDSAVLPFDPAHYRHLSFTGFGDSLFYFNELSGTMEYNMRTGKTKRFLLGKVVSRTFRDATGSMWFTTMGQGLFRLNSDEFRTITLEAPGMERSSIYAIKRIGNHLWVGDDHDYVFSFSLPDMRSSSTSLCRWTSKNRILFVDRFPGNGDSIYLAADNAMSKLCGPPPTPVPVGVKAIFKKSDSELVISASNGVYLFDVKRFRITDTLWKERSTTIYYHGDTGYIGTLNGLYRLAADRSVSFMGKENSFLQKRIAAVVESADHILWVASYDAGVTGYRHGQIVTSFNGAKGLTSDICRALYLQDNYLWIGTDKGLNKIDLVQPGYPITHYTSKDGLGSDIVNSIYADSSIVFVGTPAGLSYFDESKVNISEECRLHLLSIINGGRDRIADSAHFQIPYHDKRLRLEFAGISYRSVGDIVYRYRLTGLDTGWQETKETFLDYQTLPSGKYIFQLQAVNKFGTRSHLLSLPFEVVTPFWQTLWFYAGLGVAFLVLAWLFVAWRVRNVQRREHEREELTQRLAALENTALQAQMNPHFIFNCLNSIQQYIFDQDVLTANKYLTGFSKLIRTTLHNSSRDFIPLSDEIEFLSTYLSLEKGRFKDKMEYTIEVSPAITAGHYVIPPMLIQPFVENAMRHGLRHKTNGKGYIHIGIVQSGQRLMVTVEDNGVGRKQAAAYKTREHIEYQSRGMSLTSDRIRMMNIKYKEHISVEVVDLQDSMDRPAGTRVIMQFPLFFI